MVRKSEKELFSAGAALLSCACCLAASSFFAVCLFPETDDTAIHPRQKEVILKGTRIFRNCLCAALAALLLLTLTACEKKQQPGAMAPATSRVQTPLPDDADTLRAQAAVDETLIVCTRKQLFALENGSWNELSVPDDFLYGNAICEDKGGGLWLLYTTGDNSLAIARYGADFAVQETLAVPCDSKEQLYFQLLKTDGGFYLLSRERLVRVDESGAQTAQDIDDTRDGRFFASMAEVNGKLYVLAPTAFDDLERSYDELRQLDPVTLEETAVLLEKQGLCGMGADAGGQLVLSRAADLFAFGPETGEETQILRWSALDCAAITGVFLQSADGWLCEDDSGAVTELCRVPGLAPERKVLMLAILADTGMETQAMQMVQDFNQSGAELRVEATVYNETQEENTLDFLRTQIMAGDAPDLFLFVNDGYDERPIAPRKVCMDLLTLPDFGVSPDELLPGLYDALTQDGKLYELPLTVTLETFLAPSDLISEPGVTMQELEAARQKAGEDYVPFESWNTPDNLFWLSIPFYLSKYVDRETGACSFETQEFYDFLLWCKTWGGDGSVRNTDIEEKAILHYQQLGYVDQLCGMRLNAKEYLGYPDGYTYVGIPNEDTCGTMMSITLSLGVSGSCRNEAGAAEFLTFCRGYELRGLPAEMLRLQAEIDAQRATGQEDGMEIRNVISSEDAEKFYALLEEKPVLKDQDDALVDILCEEAAPYFAGDCDEQTAAKTMQARTKLLLLEQAG